MSHKIVATTESVRATFSWEDNYPHEGSHNDDWAREFDRWLDEHDRAVASSAVRSAALYAQEMFNEEGGSGYARVRTSWLFGRALAYEKGEIAPQCGSSGPEES